MFIFNYFYIVGSSSILVMFPSSFSCSFHMQWIRNLIWPHISFESMLTFGFDLNGGAGCGSMKVCCKVHPCFIQTLTGTLFSNEVLRPILMILKATRMHFEKSVPSRNTTRDYFKKKYKTSDFQFHIYKLDINKSEIWNMK